MNLFADGDGREGEEREGRGSGKEEKERWKFVRVEGRRSISLIPGRGNLEGKTEFFFFFLASESN